MYLLVCFNVILDLLMGCSSGGAAVRDDDQASATGTKMVHFRTLDWGMPSLRRVLVHLDYILEPRGEIVASSITYAGFVGVLTGVRKGLSLSLNFRGIHNDSSGLLGNAEYYGHLGMVLLGLRPSISSLLRRCLIPGSNGRNNARANSRGDIASLPYYETVVQEMSYRTKSLRSTACYLCFSSGRETTVIEKDLNTAKSNSSTSFIVVTNADIEAGDGGKATHKNGAQTPKGAKSVAVDAASPMTALDELIEDANERKACAERNYRKLLRRHSRSSRSSHRSRDSADPRGTLPTVDDIVKLAQQYPTTNECTHFAAVMDPVAGNFAWSRYWRRQID